MFPPFDDKVLVLLREDRGEVWLPVLRVSLSLEDQQQDKEEVDSEEDLDSA